MTRAAPVALLAAALVARAPAANAAVESTADMALSPAVVTDPVRLRAEALAAIVRARAKVTAKGTGRRRRSCAR